MKNSDIAIIGSGCIGMAIARGLLELNPRIKVTIFEKEADFASHASARNSGVLHAGFYYSPESMKARFCRDGRDEIEKLAMKYAIPIQRVGKVVVAQNEDESSRLEILLQRGLVNGVELERFPANELSYFEPLAQTVDSFLWSPNTAISNPSMINQALRVELQSKNVEFISGAKMQIKNGKWFNNDVEVSSKYFVNAAGAWALDIAHQLNIGSNYRTMPFLGLYKQTMKSHLPIKTLVYPVPHPINPFLGVHFTITIDGNVKIGPSALPIFGKEQYSILSRVTREELVAFGKNLVCMSRGSKHDLWSMMKYEIPKLATSNLVNAASKLVPSATQVINWTRKNPGIRGQLINTQNGELLQDFQIEHSLNSTHVLNAVSPGWTASIPFGRHVAQLVSERLNSNS